MIGPDDCGTWNVLFAQAPFAALLAVYTIVLAKFQAKHDVFIFTMLANRLDKQEAILKDIKTAILQRDRI
jgi:hypothetical protein